MELTKHHAETRSIQELKQNQTFQCKRKNYSKSTYKFLTIINKETQKIILFIVLLYYIFLKMSIPPEPQIKKTYMLTLAA
jgi:hypothetical protein